MKGRKKHHHNRLALDAQHQKYICVILKTNYLNLKILSWLTFPTVKAMYHWHYLFKLCSDLNTGWRHPKSVWVYEVMRVMTQFTDLAYRCEKTPTLRIWPKQEISFISLCVISKLLETLHLHICNNRTKLGLCWWTACEGTAICSLICSTLLWPLKCSRSPTLVTSQWSLLTVTQAKQGRKLFLNAQSTMMVIPGPFYYHANLQRPQVLSKKSERGQLSSFIHPKIQGTWKAFCPWMQQKHKDECDHETSCCKNTACSCYVFQNSH